MYYKRSILKTLSKGKVSDNQHGYLKNIEILLSLLVLVIWSVSWFLQYHINLTNVKNNIANDLGFSIKFVHVVLVKGGLVAIACVLISNLFWYIILKYVFSLNLKLLFIRTIAILLFFCTGMFSGIMFWIINISSITAIFMCGRQEEILLGMLLGTLVSVCVLPLEIKYIKAFPVDIP